MKEVGLSIMLFFNTLLGSVDPTLSNERGAIENIKKEIKLLQRQIEWESAEDSLEIIKQYPPLKLEEPKSENI